MRTIRNVVMLTGRFIREEDALLQLGILAWLIKKYGPPKKPKVPSPLHKTEQLADISWTADDTRSAHSWAQDTFSHIKQLCGMDNWSIQIAPYSDKLNNSVRMLTTENWNINSKEPYYVDGYGRPVIYYDPLNCKRPGYFVSRVIYKLAEIKLMNFPLEEAVTPLQSKIMILVTACYMRQGFSMAALLKAEPLSFWDKDIDPKVIGRVTDRTLAFSTCVILLSQRLTPEQIVATYGTVMSKKFRKKVRPACKQAENYDAELTILKILANPTHESFETDSYAASA